MFEKETDKIGEISIGKIKYMQKSPLGYLLLSALAGAYLGFGIVLIFSIGGPIAASPAAPFLKLIMGAGFGIALSLVIFAGSELFTGNHMVFAVGKLSSRVGWKSILILFALCYLGNFLGSVLLSWLVDAGGSLGKPSNDLVLKVSAVKMNLGAKELFFRGVLCNWLVCLAVWTSLRIENEAARLVMIFWCLFAFIASGFEHSIANMTLLSYALMIPHGAEISIAGFWHNQLWVVLGNFLGGALMVGFAYWFASSFHKKKEALEVSASALAKQEEVQSV